MPASATRDSNFRHDALDAKRAAKPCPAALDMVSLVASRCEDQKLSATLASRSCAI